MAINIIDSLLLPRVKQHLQIDTDVSDDDSLVQMYMDNSNAYVTNYTQKTFEVYNNTETFQVWENDLIFLDWETEVRNASVTYQDGSLVTKTISVQVFAGNIIRETTPADYNGGAITVLYTPYVDTANIPTSHQARLLMIGDWYMSREDKIVGQQVNDLSNTGVNALLNSIKLGFI